MNLWQEQPSFETAQSLFSRTGIYWRISSHTNLRDVLLLIDEIAEDEAEDEWSKRAAQVFQGNELWREHISELIIFFADKNKKNSEDEAERQERMVFLGYFYKDKNEIETSYDDISLDSVQGLRDSQSEAYDINSILSMINTCYYYLVMAVQRSGLSKSFLFDRDFFTKISDNSHDPYIRQFIEVLKTYKQRFLYEIKMALAINPEHQLIHFYKIFMLICLRSRSNRWEEEYDSIVNDMNLFQQHPLMIQFFGINVKSIIRFINDQNEEMGNYSYELPAPREINFEPAVGYDIFVPRPEGRPAFADFITNSDEESIDDLVNERRPFQVDLSDFPPELVEEARQQIPLGFSVRVPSPIIDMDQTEQRQRALEEFSRRHQVNPATLLTDAAKLIMEENSRIADALRKCMSSTKVIHEIEGLEARQTYLKQSLLECIKDDVEPILQEPMGEIEEPLVLASDGNIYAKSTLSHLASMDFSGIITSPLTREILDETKNIELGKPKKNVEGPSVFF